MIETILTISFRIYNFFKEPINTYFTTCATSLTAAQVLIPEIDYHTIIMQRLAWLVAIVAGLLTIVSWVQKQKDRYESKKLNNAFKHNYYINDEDDSHLINKEIDKHLHKPKKHK